MATTSVKANHDREAITGLTGYQGLRSGAGRSPWPADAGFQSRPPIGGPTVMIDFVRSATRQPCVWPVLVIPAEYSHQLGLHRSASNRYAGQCLQDLLSGENHPFHNRNAALFTNGAEAWSNVVASAPKAIGLAGPELRALITNQVPRRCAGKMDRASQELSYFDGVWLMIEDGKALHAA